MLSAILGLALAAVAVAGRAQEATPTYHRDVAPILLESCAGCHKPEGSAPFSLATYEDARARAVRIAEVTASRTMPPWLPEPGYGSFAGERRLESEEIATLAAWARAAAPEGDPAGAPPAPELGSGWRLGEPDLVIEMENEYRLPAEGHDVYRNFVLPVPVDARRFVRAIELRPGGRNVVHHARILVDRTGESRRLDAEDPEPGYDGMLVDAAEFPDGVFLGWAPGKAPLADDEAFVWTLEPSMDLVLQLHMMPRDEVESVRPAVGLYFTDRAPRVRAAVLQLGSRAIDIPAGESEYVVSDSYVLPADVSALGVYPHAHYLCKEMQVYATLPDGSKRWLLWIPSWDFYWQDEYRYESPVPLPEGTAVTMRYVYDNSQANPRNPFHPPRRVRWGPKSSDEMGDLLLMVVPRDPPDRDALVEDFRRNELRQEVEGYEAMLAAGDAPEPATLRHELAFTYQELGRTADAIAEWERVVRAKPELAEAHYNLGGALAAEGRVEEAIDSLERAVAVRPDYAEAHNNLGVLLQSAGRLDAAIASYLRAIEARHDYAFAEHNLGSALFARGRIDEAVAHLERAIEIEPGYARARYTLGSALGAAGRFEEEVEQYRLVLEVEPDYPEALNNLGGVLAALGRAHEAIVPLRRAVELRPDYVLAWSNLAEALAQAGELDGAARAYREVLARSPSDARAHLGLATVLRRSRKSGQALTHYTLALRAFPADPEALAGLAWSLAVVPDDALRDPGRAVRLARRAVAVTSQNPFVLDALAVSHASAEEYSDAVRAGERALASALARGDEEHAEGIRARLALFQRRVPYLETEASEQQKD